MESSIVLIPLLTLFLTGMQISMTVHTRNMEKIAAQSDASQRALEGEFQEGDEFIHIANSGTRGGLDLLVSHRERTIGALIGSDRKAEVDGIAIVENQR